MTADERNPMTASSSDMKCCVKCGAEFKRSPADRTVNCPDCRRKPTATTYSNWEHYAVKIAEAKSRGYAARRAGDQAGEDQAVEDMRHWQRAAKAAGVQV